MKRLAAITVLFAAFVLAACAAVDGLDISCGGDGRVLLGDGGLTVTCRGVPVEVVGGEGGSATVDATIVDAASPVADGSCPSPPPAMDLIAEGDSITASITNIESHRWPFWLTRGRAVIRNSAVSGSQASDVLVRQTIWGVNTYAPRAAIVMIGTNNIGYYQARASVVSATLQIVSTMRAKGIGYVALIAIIDRAWTSDAPATSEQRRQLAADVNADVVAFSEACKADGGGLGPDGGSDARCPDEVLRPDLDARFAPPNANTDRRWYSDGSHLTAEAAQAIAWDFAEPAFRRARIALTGAP